MTIAFDNSYARLPERFYARQSPVPVTAPAIIAVNDRLARELGIDPEWLRANPGMLTGNTIPEGASPLAQAYAGHQFGGWVPQLGDGRAVLLGEIVAPSGRRVDIALKGSGQTPFSRRGDGRAWVGPVIREYILSEAMAARGVPLTPRHPLSTNLRDFWAPERLGGARERPSWTPQRAGSGAGLW